MSGLEPLAALGLACNVMQVIDFACETTSACRAIFRTGTPNPSFTSATAHMTKALEDLNRFLDSSPKSSNLDEQELLDVAKESLAVASDLKAEVGKISNEASKGKYSSAISGALKVKFRKGKIEKLEQSLAAHQKVLETQILIRI
jgi:hypothetical protein